MKRQLFEALENLRKNPTNFVIHFEENRRIKTPFSEIYHEINRKGAQLNYLKGEGNLKNIALIGPISLDWMLIDLACIKEGYRTIAIPETLPARQITEICRETSPELILADAGLASQLESLEIPIWYFGAGKEKTARNFDSLPEYTGKTTGENKMLTDYSVVFSSGTSGQIKKINLKFKEIPKPEPQTIGQKLKALPQLIQYKRSFWTRKDNLLILFMPFSHVQQRTFARQALIRGINILLSNPTDCFKHLVIEKPNIMIAVPVFYQTLARQIEDRIRKFPPRKQRNFQRFNQWGINSWKDKNLIKRLFSHFLFDKIRKIYGGNPDFFVTGSAAIGREVLETFYRVGVQIYEAYGQSETNIIAMNMPNAFRLGSVGKPRFPLQFSETGEISIPFDPKLHDPTVVKLNAEGWIETGDVGYLDEDGFLFLTGRQDDVIVLENGKKVFPTGIESQLSIHPEIHQAVVCTLNQTRIHAMLTVSEKQQPKEATSKSIQVAIQKVNARLQDHERIRSFTLFDTPFTIENKCMTPSFKLIRKNIMEQGKSKDVLVV